MPLLSGAASTAAGAEPSVIPPQIGFALAQTFSLSLPFGLRLGAEGTVGDRLGVGGLPASVGVSSAVAAPPTSALAMRAGVTLSTHLAMPFSETPLRIGLGFATAGTLPGIGLGSATTAALPGSAPRGAAGQPRYDDAHPAGDQRKPEPEREQDERPQNQAACHGGRRSGPTSPFGHARLHHPGLPTLRGRSASGVSRGGAMVQNQGVLYAGNNKCLTGPRTDTVRRWPGGGGERTGPQRPRTSAVPHDC
jgi:hypothetical protein